MHVVGYGNVKVGIVHCKGSPDIESRFLQEILVFTDSGIDFPLEALHSLLIMFGIVQIQIVLFEIHPFEVCFLRVFYEFPKGVEELKVIVLQLDLSQV